MKFVSYSYLVNHQDNYQPRDVLKSIIVCIRCKDALLIQKHKLSLFLKLGKITIKNINNIFFLNKDMKQNGLYTNDDLVNECYMIMEYCLKSFDWKRKTEFFWFYNKALTRGLVRLFERHCKNMRDTQKLEDVRIVVNPQQQFLGYYLDKYKCKGMEKIILLSKVNNEKKKELMQRTRLTELQYRKHVNNLKEKFNFLQHEQKIYF